MLFTINVTDLSESSPVQFVKSLSTVDTDGLVL